MRKYTNTFYTDKQTLCLNSANQIVPWLIHRISVKNVIDVGCGNGLWLSVFNKNNITDVFGYDGHWVDKSLLAIPDDCFKSVDLQNDKFDDKKADLVISLEVAEHLPEEFSDKFIYSLTNISSLALFSAAVPGQGGTNHVNEQWPGYWIDKFDKYGFVVIDCIRNNFWDNEMVESWYKQNMFLFAKKEELATYRHLTNESSNAFSFNMIHPEMFEGKIHELTNPENYSLKKLLKKLPSIILNKVKFKLGQS
jgi:hypothetical protein